MTPQGHDPEFPLPLCPFKSPHLLRGCSVQTCTAWLGVRETESGGRKPIFPASAPSACGGKALYQELQGTTRTHRTGGDKSEHVLCTQTLFPAACWGGCPLQMEDEQTLGGTLCLSRLRQSIPNLWCSQREGCTEAPQAQSPSRQSKWGLVHQHSMAPKEKLAVSALMNINRIFHSESLQRSCLDHSIHNNSFMSLQIIKIGLESSMEVGMGLSVLCSGTLQVPLALVSPFLKSPKARARWGQ